MDRIRHVRHVPTKPCGKQWAMPAISSQTKNASASLSLLDMIPIRLDAPEFGNTLSAYDHFIAPQLIGRLP